MRRLPLFQIRRHSSAPSHPMENTLQKSETSGNELSREDMLKEKWKEIREWPFPGMEMTTPDTSGDKIHRPFGIFDDPNDAFSQLIDSAPYAFVKSPIPEFYKNPMPTPMEDSEIYTEDHVESNAIVLKTITDRPMWEQALGEQLFRTDDFNSNSSEYHPLGYGLPIHTTALIVEDDINGERYYHTCGGRSDHKTFVEGHCLTMRVDPTLFFHILYYFGEVLSQQSGMTYHHKYRGLCIWGHGMDEEDADFIDGFFHASRLAIQVDLDRLDEGCEGFIPVKYKHIIDGPRVVPPNTFGCWKEGSEGIFMWQNLFHSVPVTTSDVPRNTREHWCDPYLLRPLPEINHRAFNGAATDDGSANFHYKWGNDGLKGERLRNKTVDAHVMDESDPIDLTKQNFSGMLGKSSSRVITNSHAHGFAHPMFTTALGNED